MNLKLSALTLSMLVSSLTFAQIAITTRVSGQELNGESNHSFNIEGNVSVTADHNDFIEHEGIVITYALLQETSQDCTIKTTVAIDNEIVAEPVIKVAYGETGKIALGEAAGENENQTVRNLEVEVTPTKIGE